MNPLRTAVFLCVLGATATAQVTPGSVGFRWVGGSGAAAGTACSATFSCVPATVNVTGGEPVTLEVRGLLGGAFIIGIAGAANQCQSVPGVLNMLVLDASAAPAVFGTMSTPSPVLACPSGLGTFQTTFPQGVPPTTTFVLQAVAIGPAGTPAFTVAIVVTVV